MKYLSFSLKVFIYTVLAIAAIFIVVLVLNSFMGDVNGLVNKSRERVTQTYPLYSLELDSQTTASFILGTGSEKGTYYYVAYKVAEDGGKQLFTMDAKDTIVYDTLASGEQAYYKVDVNGFGDEVDSTRKLYVPKDTIKKDYDLSLISLN